MEKFSTSAKSQTLTSETRKRVKKAIISEDKHSETKIMVPALRDESIIVPTAPITKAGPALTQLKAILFASPELIFFCPYKEAAIEQPTGKPPKREKITALPAAPERSKIFLKNVLLFLPKKSITPLKTAKEEITRNGKSDGIIVWMQSSSPVFTPPEQTDGYLINIKAESKHKKVLVITFMFLFFFNFITHTIYVL